MGLLKATERTDLLDDPRFTTRKGRSDQIVAILQEEFSKKPRAYWLEALDANGVPNAPLYAIQEVFQDPQVKHLGIPRQIHHPQMGSSKLIGSPINLSDTPPQFIRPAPLLGEHTDEILKRFGYDNESIENLRARGVV